MNILDAATHRPSDGGPSFGFGHRAYRAIWSLAWLLLAAYTVVFLLAAAFIFRRQEAQA